MDQKLELSISQSGRGYDERLEVTLRLKQVPSWEDYDKVVKAAQVLQEVYQKYTLQTVPPVAVEVSDD